MHICMCEVLYGCERKILHDCEGKLRRAYRLRKHITCIQAWTCCIQPASRCTYRGEACMMHVWRVRVQVDSAQVTCPSNIKSYVPRISSHMSLEYQVCRITRHVYRLHACMRARGYGTPRKQRHILSYPVISLSCCISIGNATGTQCAP